MSEVAPPSLSVPDVLSALPPEVEPIVRRLVRHARELGLRVHLVGGPVRDLLLGRPIRDVDLLVEDPAATGAEATPSEAARSAETPSASAGDDAAASTGASTAAPLGTGAGAATGDPAEPPSPAAILARAAAGTDARVLAHGRFGTVRFEEEGAHVDLASMRRERYRRPGALPDVEPGGFEDDMARRDFSVNAMAIPLPGLRRNTSTSVLDPQGGLADLEQRRLRVLHAKSFHDDPTRALRAARLAARLDFTLARRTRAALRDALRDGVFGAVSGERLRREIQRCFSDAEQGLNPAQALRLLASWHVLQALEPGLELRRESIAPLRRLGRFVLEPAWKHAATPPWQPGLALWLAPLGKALRRRCLARFSIRGEVAERIVEFPTVRERVLQELARVRGRGAVDELLSGLHEDTLQALYATCDPPERKRLVRWAAEDRPRRSPVSGTDLLALGLEGPDVGRVLARLRAAHLDGDVANREEALALATELARRERSPRAKARARRPGRAGGSKGAARAAGRKATRKARARAGGAKAARGAPAKRTGSTKKGAKKAAKRQRAKKGPARSRAQTPPPDPPDGDSSEPR